MVRTGYRNLLPRFIAVIGFLNDKIILRVTKNPQKLLHSFGFAEYSGFTERNSITRHILLPVRVIIIESNNNFLKHDSRKLNLIIFSPGIHLKLKAKRK